MFSLLRYSTSAVHPKFSDATYVLSTMLSLLTLFLPQISYCAYFTMKRLQTLQSPGDKMAELGFKLRIFSPILRALCPQNTIT